MGASWSTPGQVLTSILGFQIASKPSSTSSSSPTVTPFTRNYMSCALPDGPVGIANFTHATPEQLNINSAILKQAIRQATPDGGVAVKVFRNNCLIGESLDLPFRDTYKANLWSATKGIVGILAGFAFDRGLMNLDDPMDKFLPTGPGWGDAAHRAITIRQLLNENAGTPPAVAAETFTTLLDVSLPQQMLAEKLAHTPGTFFTYSQRVPDMMAYMVSRAVGQELQLFAQENLFGPLGISEADWTWLTDRSGNSYGWSYLYMNSPSQARIGLMLQNGGMWNGKRILSQKWVDMLSEPSPTNPCYGLLLWTNRGDTCISPTGFNKTKSYYCPAAPKDTFAFSGSPTQKTFMIPSLNMTVAFLGIGNESLLTQTMWYDFFHTLMPGVTDVPYVKPIPYETEALNASLVLVNLDPTVLVNQLYMSPECNILECNGEVPVGGLVNDTQKLPPLWQQELASYYNGDLGTYLSAF